MATIGYFEGDRGYHAAHGYQDDRHVAEEGPAPMRLGAVVNWAGALLSVGLVVGMGVWAFQLTMRDVSGVPVIRALEGPMRVQPEDPGGVQAAHQGLAVNRIAEGAEAAPVPDQLVLAPPPVDLAEVEIQVSSASQGDAPAPTPTPNPVAAPQPVAAVATPEDLPTPTEASAETQALIERLMAREQVQALRAPAAATPPAPQADAGGHTELAYETPTTSLDVSVIPASVPGVARSLRPASRPDSLRTVTATPVSAVAPASAPTELNAASLSEGTRLVQLGAFDSADVARSEWDRLASTFPDYFAGRARVIQEASSGGSSFFRLRAHGFDDLAASRRFCAALVARNASCIPVTVR